MGILRVLLCILFPPLAVVDKGCGSFLLVLLLTCTGWIPGVLAALVITSRQETVIIVENGVPTQVKRKSGPGSILLMILLLCLLGRIFFLAISFSHLRLPFRFERHAIRHTILSPL